MTPLELLQTIEASGGMLVIRGDRIRCELPEELAPLIDAVRAVKPEMMRLLHQRSTSVGARPVPALPTGVQLIAWKPKCAPVAISRVSVVTNVETFITRKLDELGHALAGRSWQAGNWQVREIIEALEQVGVCLAVVPANS